jgi:hypothetical protein
MGFQELIKFEQGAHVCTWITDQLMKRKIEFQICEFSRFTLSNLIRIYLNMPLVYLELGLIT